MSLAIPKTDFRDHWIEELKRTKEFTLLAETEGLEFKDLTHTLKTLVDDQFIETAKETGISRREKMLGLTPYADDTLETRRFRVLSRWNSQLPYTYRALIHRLNLLCGENGYAIELNHNEYSLLIKVELTVKRMEQEVREMSRSMAPANLLVTVELRYRQHHELKKYTHAQLKAFRHRELREEAFNL